MYEYILLAIVIFWVVYALVLFIRYLAGSEGFTMFDPDVQVPYIDMKFKQNYPTTMYKITPEKYIANNNWYKTTVN